MQQTPTDDILAHLGRLSQKPGVQSTLIISRDTGAIVQTTGLESRESLSNADDTAVPSRGHANGHPGEKEDKVNTAKDVAQLVYNFVKAAGSMVQDLNGTADDELKLLRLRTKKNELVIVPDVRFIAVVIHDTPAA